MFIRHYDLLFPVIRESNIETNTNNTQSKHSADVFCTVILNMKLFLTNTLTMELIRLTGVNLIHTCKFVDRGLVKFLTGYEYTYRVYE